MTNNHLEIVFSDLDGTLISRNNAVHQKDLEAFYTLGQKNVIRVIATGRSYFSLKKVINYDFPIDYLIFSNGAGILNWKTKEIILINQFEAENVIPLISYLIKKDVDFMIHKAIPENHRFFYFESSNPEPDFLERCNIYKEFINPLDTDLKYNEAACQLLVVLKNNETFFKKIKKEIKRIENSYKIIRTTSPLDNESIWMEIFPEAVSKGHAAQWLCEYLGLDNKKTLAVGNDYNDLDLLAWSRHSFVVANSASELLYRYNNTSSCFQAGFANAVKSLL